MKVGSWKTTPCLRPQELHSGWAVDQAILAERNRVVLIRFSHEYDVRWIALDHLLGHVAEELKHYAVIYLVDISKVTDFNNMYELYEPFSLMFFFRNRHIKIDLGTRIINKINWALDLEDKQHLIEIVRRVYHGAWNGMDVINCNPRLYSRL